LGYQFPVPRHKRFRRDDGGYLAQDTSGQLLGFYCQTPALIVAEAQSLATQLLAQHSILFLQIVDDVPLLLAHPS
jgi:hypothetical protein